MNDNSSNPINTQETVPSHEHKPQPKRLFWRKLGLSLLTCLLLLAAIFTWLISTNSGLAFTLFQLPKLSGTHISANKLSGSLLAGFQGDEILIENESSKTKISHITFAWQARQLWHKHLHINNLALGNILITSKDTPPKEEATATLPESLNLPISIQIDNIEVGSIQLTAENNQAPIDIINTIQAAFDYHQQRYRLRILSLQNSWSNSEGEITLASHFPFALNGNINSKGLLDDIAIDNTVTLSGSLNETQLSAQLTGKGISLQADTQLRPFAPLLYDKIQHLLLTGDNINPKAFHSQLPSAQLTFNIHAQPRTYLQKNQLSGSIDVLNKAPKWFDQQGIAIKTIQGAFMLNENNIAHIEPLHIAFMQKGSINTQGEINFNQQSLHLSSNIAHLSSQDLISSKILGELNGEVLTQNSFQNPDIRWQLNTGRADVSGSLNIDTDTKNQQRTLWLKEGKILPQNGGQMLLSGSYELFQNQKVDLTISSKQFNPAQLYPDFPSGSINGEINLNALIAKQQYRANMQFSPSQLSGASLSGSGQISYEDGHLSQADNHIILGKNNIRTHGAFGKKGDTLTLDIQAPELNRFGFGLQGALNAKGSISSIADSFSQLDVKLAGSAHQFALNTLLKIDALDFNLLASPDKNRPLNISTKGKGIVVLGSRIDNIDATLKGTLNQHYFQASSSLNIDNKPLNITAHAQGSLNEQQWQGQINTLNLNGALDLKLLAPFRLEAGSERVILNASRWEALLGSLALEKLTWDKQNGLSSKGRADNLYLAQLHNFYQPPIKHDLVLSGDWDMRYNQSPSGYLNVRQQSGDILLPDERETSLLLEQLTLNSQLSSKGIVNKISGQTRYGKVAGNINILSTFGKDFADAPLSGQINIISENLDSLRSFLPIGQTLSGQLHANIALSGHLKQPQLSGSITGENLNYRHREVGVALTDGSLKSHLKGQKWVVDALTFKRKNGTLTLSGEAAYHNNQPDVKAKVLFQAYPILDQINRYLAVSGQSDIRYNTNGIILSGSLKTNEGRFGFQDSSAPSLSDDVVVLGEQKEAQTQSMPLHLNLDFDLNDKFSFSGQGLNVLLGGKLNVQSQPNHPFVATGSVNVINGRYKAYGQDLVIKKGIISFVGPLTNPNLNIRAERRVSAVGAGVEVLGNLDNPRINLVANEPMSEKDKLSWLILNRASSGSGTDEAALTAAAGAFLAGSINDKIGLVDDFGLTSQQTRNKQTGEMNPAQQVLTFGKQLTHDLYLGYEAGLETTSQSVKLVYQLSRSFQAIARAGTESSGGELKYIKRFD